MNDILKNNDEINKEGAACTSIEQKKKWWNERFALDKKLGDFLGELEYYLKLNRIRDMLTIVTNVSEDMNEVLSSLNEFVQKKLGTEAKATLLSLLYLNFACGSTTLADSQLTETISTILQNSLSSKESTKSIQVHNEDLAEFKQIIDSIMFLDFKRHFRAPKHLFIVLDKNLCGVPLENIPSLRNYSISRVPSLEILENMLKTGSPKTKSLDYRMSSKNTFYLLNPSTDLKNTENRFESLLKADDSWDGIVGKIPEDYGVIQKVRQSNLFLYFGHGGAEKYIKSNELRNNGMKKLPCALLFGCSSGYLKEVGQFDPYGTVYDYIAGGSPSVLVNLWNVTDKDLDRFTLGLFHNWGLLRMEGKKVEAPKNLAESLMCARDECKLRYLTGCAPVLYGIPVSLIDAE
jgi:separase